MKAMRNTLVQVWGFVIGVYSEKIYLRHIDRLKKKGKIRVVFLVSENEKWSGLGALHTVFKTSDTFVPIVALTKFRRHSRSDLEKNEMFFARKKISAVTIFDYKKNKPISLLSLKPDIVFYQQPWDLYFNQSPSYCAIRSLSLYLPYSVLVIDNPAHYSLNFHKHLWKIFLDSELTLKRFVQFSGVSNKCIVTGNPKLELVNDLHGMVESLHGPVIFAPHHSFEEGSLGLATFLWSGFVFLDFAEKYSNINFIFKPHPRFWFALEQNSVFSKEKIDEYHERLRASINITICEDGDYVKMFQKSRMLITDCGSFLAEYYLLNKPVIHLESDKSVGLTEIGKIVTENYYSVRNTMEFIDAMNMLILDNNDPLYEYRKIDKEVFELESVKPSVKIKNFLEKQFEADNG